MFMLLTTALLLACSSEPTETADTAGSTPAAEPWLDLGTGLTEFIPIEDGAELELVYGPQGGWHIDTTAMFGGVELEGASLSYTATDPDSGALLNYPYEALLHTSLVQVIEDGWLRIGDRVVFDIASDQEILGRTVLLEVTLIGGDGASLSADHVITVVSP